MGEQVEHLQSRGVSEVRIICVCGESEIGVCGVFVAQVGGEIVEAAVMRDTYFPISLLKQLTTLAMLGEWENGTEEAGSGGGT